MSMPKTSLEAPSASGRTGSGRVALVATDSAQARIIEILTQAGVRADVFKSAKALAEELQEDEPALIVLWIEDVGAGLAGRIEPLTQRFANALLMVVCQRVERWDVRAALAAGATGVVLWDDLELALLPSIQAVIGGQTCVPRRHARQVDPPMLSTREKQILGLVVMGFTNGKIAEQLFLAESTVKSHLSSAFGKLGVRSRNEAVQLILDPERGLGMGILALGGDPIRTARTPTG